MAGVDKLGLFPNSMMGGAVKRGQSRFRSIDSGTGSTAILGVDIPNQFPNSKMGNAVKIGNSQIISGDVAGAGSGGAPSAFTTWNASDLSGLVISADKLNVSATTSAGGARGIMGKTTGKYYWEAVFTTNGSTWNFGAGIADSTAPLTYLGAGGQAGPSVTVDRANGYVFNGSSGSPAIGGVATGAIVCFAADLTNNLFWARNTVTGTWNGSGTANPATGLGGRTIPTGSYIWYPFAGFSGVASGQNITANFGTTAFAGGVPSGFTGWG